MTKPRKRPRYIGTAQRRGAREGAGHTWFVRITKFMLPLIALTIVAVVITKLTKVPDIKISATPAQDKTTPGQIDLVNPRYEGLDEKKRPYTVTADRAHRVMGDDQVVALDNPKGDITLEDGGWLAVSSAHGLYNNTKSTLYLSGGVTVYHDRGYEMHLKDIDIDIKAHHAQTAQPVDAQGPVGRLVAQGMEVTDEGALVTFGGPATLTLWVKNAAPGEKHG